MKTKKVLNSEQKLKRKIDFCKSLITIASFSLIAIVGMLIAIQIVTVWLPSGLSISIGAIGVSFENYIRNMTVLDFMLGLSILLFETILWTIGFIFIIRKSFLFLRNKGNAFVDYIITKKGA